MTNFATWYEDVRTIFSVGSNDIYFHIFLWGLWWFELLPTLSDVHIHDWAFGTILRPHYCCLPAKRTEYLRDKFCHILHYIWFLRDFYCSDVPLFSRVFYVIILWLKGSLIRQNDHSKILLVYHHLIYIGMVWWLLILFGVFCCS